MTLLEIQKVYKMNFDQFEAFAITKGYEFEMFVNDEDMNGISYVKGIGKATKYIRIYDKFFHYKKHLSYEIGDTNEILNLKTQLRNSGFKIVDTYFNEKSDKVETYRNNLFEFVLWTIPPNNINPYVTYEIAYREITD